MKSEGSRQGVGQRHTLLPWLVETTSLGSLHWTSRAAPLRPFQRILHFLHGTHALLLLRGAIGARGIQRQFQRVPVLVLLVETQQIRRRILRLDWLPADHGSLQWHPQTGMKNLEPPSAGNFYVVAAVVLHCCFCCNVFSIFRFCLQWDQEMPDALIARRITIATRICIDLHPGVPIVEVENTRLQETARPKQAHDSVHDLLPWKLDWIPATFPVLKGVDNVLHYQSQRKKPEQRKRDEEQSTIRSRGQRENLRKTSYTELLLHLQIETLLPSIRQRRLWFRLHTPRRRGAFSRVDLFVKHQACLLLQPAGLLFSRHRAHNAWHDASSHRRRRRSRRRKKKKRSRGFLDQSRNVNKEFVQQKTCRSHHSQGTKPKCKSKMMIMMKLPREAICRKMIEGSHQLSRCGSKAVPN